MTKPLALAAVFFAATALAAAGDTTAVRFATFNASLNRDSAKALIRDLSTTDNVQARNVAEIIQRVAPDVLLINEFDYDLEGKAAELFQRNYLGIGQNGAKPITYGYRFSAEVNTGVPSGFDLDNNGKVVAEPGTRGYGNDAFGFGQFPGQYGMVLYSKYPIEREQARQFRTVLWKDMPGALLPAKPDGAPWYGADALAVVRLSSKNHWDLPVRIGGRTIHVLASHPTPPAFDGPEHRNGRRNHDEIRLWADYLTGGSKARYLANSAPREAISPPTDFIILGDLNADPNDGASAQNAIDQLLNHPRIEAGFVPRSEGASEAAKLQAGANQQQTGRADQDTADFDAQSVGNLRVDYVLPSKGLKIVGGGVFWPVRDDPLSRLVKMDPVASSDHRLVYLDLELDSRE
jgi:hypothetical protein